MSGEPVSGLVGSAAFLAAHVARRPADPLAPLLWERVKSAIGRILNREPAPGDITAATIRAAVNAEPGVADALNAARANFTGLRRAEAVERVVRGARLLWINRQPQHNTWERDLFHSFGSTIAAVDSAPAALASMHNDTVHVAIADVYGADDPDGGVAAIQALHRTAADLPVVFYVNDLGGSFGSYGRTNEPNELLHLVLDRLERSRI
jgi:hypothetical protein